MKHCDVEHFLLQEMEISSVKRSLVAASKKKKKILTVFCWRNEVKKKMCVRNPDIHYKQRDLEAESYEVA